MEDLGVSGEGKIALWTGVLTTATGSMLFIFSPIWGSLADHFGRKPLLLRTYIGAITLSVGVAVLALVQEPEKQSADRGKASVRTTTPR